MTDTQPQTTHPDEIPAAVCTVQDAHGQPALPGRRMIAVSDLAGHPSNVRDDLHLSEEFLASIAAEGVRIALLITPTGDGGWRVIEGHRRLAAAAASPPPSKPT